MLDKKNIEGNNKSLGEYEPAQILKFTLLTVLIDMWCNQYY